MSVDLAADTDKASSLNRADPSTQVTSSTVPAQNGSTHDDKSGPHGSPSEDGAGTDDVDVEEEEDDEEKLKYAKLTGNISNVYRNGDSTSACFTGGDKMVVGTHNGNIHVLSLPDLASIRTYHAHQATITSISVSPIPPPPTSVLSEEEPGGKGIVSLLVPSISLSTRKTQPVGNAQHGPTSPSKPQSQRNASPVPLTANNQIYIATSSLDGHVCVSSLVDPKDVLLRNFARPVQAVALSPDYKSDRTYLSGGLAGNLILTVGGKPGVSADANTNGAAAAASGWLGSIGLGSSNGRDSVLHSGEGSISTIKWSLSGKWVVWVNEEGIKIMRSHLRLGSEQGEDAWRRIAHAGKPNRKIWQDMAGSWKARAEWIEEDKLEADDIDVTLAGKIGPPGSILGSPETRPKGKQPEKLLVGWGDAVWILHVREGGIAVNGRHAGERQIGSADIMHKLVFRDCIVSGITHYTPSLLAILAYRTRDDDDKPIKTPAQNGDESRKGRTHRRTGLRPHLRLVYAVSGEEYEVDELPMSRFETLSAQDYHLSSMYMPPPIAEKVGKDQKGALETMWEVSGGGYAQRILSSSVGVLSRTDVRDDTSSVTSPSSIQGIAPAPVLRRSVNTHPYASSAGLKLFIQSPYDCAIAIKRDVGDHLAWLLEHEQYESAYKLVEKHPEIIEAGHDGPSHSQITSRSSSPSRKTTEQQGSLVDFFADDASQTKAEDSRGKAVKVELERIGDLWVQQLVSNELWIQAGQVAGRVLGMSNKWEYWMYSFARAGKFDEISPFVPATPVRPPIAPQAYGVLLEHYLATEPSRFKEFVDKWDTSVYDIRSITTSIEAKLDGDEKYKDPARETKRKQVVRLLLDCLAKLYMTEERLRDALRCYVQAQNSEAAMSLIRDESLFDAVSEDVSGLLMLNITSDMLRKGNFAELEEASRDAVQILIDQGLQGTIPANTVIRQLQRKGNNFDIFVFLYLRGLWRPMTGITGKSLPIDTSLRRALVEDHADLAVTFFAAYDRELLMEFLRASSVYDYDKAATVCERRSFIPELVYVLGKMGQTKKALFLIIDQLGDVSQAIAFTKENPDLWNDLLDYSMDKPKFIRGLLEEVGTSINPIELVRRIPEGLEIEGLREGIQKIIRDHEIQLSISEGVAQVIRSEVVASMQKLQATRRKAIKFDVAVESLDAIDLVTKDLRTIAEDAQTISPGQTERKAAKPGYCVGCGEPFSIHETEILVGFACGHVYHISCLLRADSKDQETEVEKVISQLSRSSYNASTRSVGAKVLHAHIVQGAIQGGCQRCAADVV